MSKSRKCKEWINITVNKHITRIYYDGSHWGFLYVATGDPLECYFDNDGRYWIMGKSIDETGL
jgi:hypothetical protein